MNVLIACECSQTVCAAFRSFGHNAFSCDIEPEYGGHPEWHIICDCRKVMYGNCMFMTSDLKLHYVKKWDLVIAHPPCTYRRRLGDPQFHRGFGRMLRRTPSGYHEDGVFTP